MTTVSRIILPAAAFLLSASLVPPAVYGQELVTPGRTVRLTLSESGLPITGVVSAMTSEVWSVALSNGEVQQIRPSSVAAAEVQVTRRNTLRGTLIGGGVGLVGGLLLIATDDDNCDRDSTGICDAFVGVANNAALVWGTAGGAAVGALVGTLITSRSWVPGVAPGGVSGAVTFHWSVALPVVTSGRRSNKNLLTP